MKETIETMRLYLRQFEKDDLFAYHEIMGQPEIGFWLGQPNGFPFEKTHDLLKSHMAHWLERGYGPWAVISKSTQKLVGHCGLKYRPKFDGVELLYTLDHQLWGQGLITEAADAVVSLAFQSIGLSRLISFTQPHNQASRRVMEKQGFRFTKDIVHSGLPHVFYELKKQDWEAEPL